ncbi:MAG: hypothetical protein LBU65_14155, partial [Planctomycetaceae bacterium]|nr:hypothetical protein [Planctomycetaceae bacterium]
FDIFNYNPKIDNTIDGNSLKDPDPETTFLLERHSIASSLADYFQKKNEWWLNIYWYLVAAASLLLTFTIYAFWLDKYGIFILTANVLYTGLGLLLLGIYLYHKRMGYYSRHHSYRTVAEGLRIQIFWRLAGIQATVSDYYLGYQIGKLDWLRIAFRIMILPMICEKKETAQFGGVKKFWVDDQIDYFRKKIKTKKKSADQWDIEFSLKTRILLFAVAIWVIVKIWSSQIANILPCGGIFYFSLFAIFLAFLSIYLVLRMTYCKLKSYRSDEQRYSRLLPIFERAKKYLDSETSSIALKRRVLLDLGKEALDENADWLLLKQDVEMLQ